jgi:hypothetical protein
MIATGLRDWPERGNAARHNTTAGMYFINSSRDQVSKNTPAAEGNK